MMQGNFILVMLLGGKYLRLLVNVGDITVLIRKIQATIRINQNGGHSNVKNGNTSMIRQMDIVSYVGKN
jgi:hypothetical protein